MTDHPESRDLDALAQHYVLGELSTTESERFESRLADDDGACEAVARAVALVEGLTPDAAVPTVTRARPNTRWIATAALIAVAASLTIVFVIRPPAARDLDAEQLIASWIELGDIESEYEPEATWEDDPTDEETDDPGWIYSALEGNK